MLPVKEVKLWLSTYPSFASMFLSSYEKHYQDLLNTTKEVICLGLEQRLLNYLASKSALANSTALKITHQEIANDLGTSREVISRIMKKLSKEEKVKQDGRIIKFML